jgi:EAL domain-containing protein (putative c-di-GMP-specific phosphodiesterase class I)
MIGIYSKEPENKLKDKLLSIAGDGTWRALHFRFSKLLEQYQTAYQKKIIINILMDHLKDASGGIYSYPDNDVFALASGLTKNQIDRLIYQLRYFFSDDPLAYTIDNDENPEFAQIYDLGVDYERFSKVVDSKSVIFEKPTKVEKSAKSVLKPKITPSSPDVAIVRSPKDKTLSSTNLATIENQLSNIDISRVLRKQAICAISSKQEMRRIFEEYYINIAHLQKLFTDEVSLNSNRWLFKYVTQLLDYHMIKLLSGRPNIYFENPVSINFNIDTVTSNTFAEFDKKIKPMVKATILIEIQISDVFADMHSFIAAKNRLQKLGYRVCLDGLSELSFMQVDRAKLGFDMAKMHWREGMGSSFSANEILKMTETIAQYGQNRVILCRCDTEEAIEWGKSVGIALFQGRYVDYRLNPEAKLIN